MASPAKKARREGKTKDFFAKQSRKSTRNFLEVGDKGFLVTCNFKEKDSVREVYRLLNEYYGKLHQKAEGKDDVENAEDDGEDIAAQLQNQIDKAQQDVKERTQKFQSIDTGVQNCLFIKTTVEDPLALGTSIIRDLAETKAKRTKVTLRMLPIETVCKAKLEDIKNAAGLLFDKYFLKTPSTFGIIFNRRYNNDIKREEVIKELAELVSMKNSENKVNLKDPQQSIIVEILKGHCMLAVVPEYLKLKKYNLNELWTRREPEEEKESEVPASQDEEPEEEKESEVPASQDEEPEEEKESEIPASQDEEPENGKEAVEEEPKTQE